MRIKGSDDRLLLDRVAATKARARPIVSQRMWVVVEKFRAPCSIRRKAYKLVVGWIRDPDIELVDEDVQAVVEDDRQMVAET